VRQRVESSRVETRVVSHLENHSVVDPGGSDLAEGYALWLLAGAAERQSADRLTNDLEGRKVFGGCQGAWRPCSVRQTNMGLSIHYELELDGPAARAQAVVSELHAAATSSGLFERVSEIREQRAPDRGDLPDLDRETCEWVDLHGSISIEVPSAAGGKEWVSVNPEHVIEFAVQPPGAETAHFGLASHPEAVGPDRRGTAQQVRTYRWHAGCKTQYAALPSRGGTKNFLRVHIGLVELLDRASELGARVDVCDDGEFWQSRDERRLLEKLEEHNAQIAAIAGALGDALRDHDESLTAPITERQDFERLEADGRERMRRPKRGN